MRFIEDLDGALAHDTVGLDRDLLATRRRREVLVGQGNRLLGAPTKRRASQLGWLFCFRDSAGAHRRRREVHHTNLPASIDFDPCFLDERAVACAIVRLSAHEFLDCHRRNFAAQASHVIHQCR